MLQLSEISLKRNTNEGDTMMAEAKRELGALELEQVAGGIVGTPPKAPAGTISVSFVSNGPNGVDTGWLFKTTFGSVFVSAQPDDNF